MGFTKIEKNVREIIKKILSKKKLNLSQIKEIYKSLDIDLKVQDFTANLIHKKERNNSYLFNNASEYKKKIEKANTYILKTIEIIKEVEQLKEPIQSESYYRNKFNKGFKQAAFLNPYYHISRLQNINKDLTKYIDYKAKKFNSVSIINNKKKAILNHLIDTFSYYGLVDLISSNIHIDKNNNYPIFYSLYLEFCKTNNIPITQECKIFKQSVLEFKKSGF
ncbi:hypothetical protein IBE11_05240 [Francisella tularensis subsp. novicida]|uniref:hypothetical protein n=1 Tax=Francisella tularensis TaxID=263 RepID=UPI0002FD9B06|nr:hypothetical protein [Francisella tularensis]AJI44820.1 hypothetical protein AS84_683 [Francisella tularensis subsp. novicida F6168]AJJ47635.1 hypothetical protein CH70_98 [Francisella tularensis subsp. novicida]APC99171.1 hypothetical protein KX03_17 [Francisella tularensis subsp. novicida]KFJ68551.1 hypothetical protein DR83_82 [Francisella tularensis subsp. novicida]MBK2344458.1 hypothetical protein [Francisella tularensis subsp. novicida]